MQEATQAETEVDIKKLADIAVVQINHSMKHDFTNVGFRGHSFAAMYEKIVSGIEEIRRDGIFATVDYQAIYDAEKSPRTAACMHLALYRAMMYFQMIHDPQFESITPDIDTFYSLHLAWHYRLRDKIDAKEGSVLTHKWLN